ncbi:sorbosone dehydrogenase family protein [Pigmentiphaga aceris]|uniref:Sorbosone dehydrogenase family protein n=1 Tax=Pigmentiphaga aceris TaxID=1940612 RepID=A0A5C0B1Z9_9BURK|nr:sorbosone dehydrogenase family protein [Pigmentiphaga aceris]QEI07743.1 sorbosone dehydrogenase family protein [Pigmentiphaga aceris]
MPLLCLSTSGSTALQSVLLAGCVIAFSLGLSACSDTAKHPEAAGFGPNPVLPDPQPRLLPTVNIAPASPWPPGTRPSVAAGMKVQAFADGLDHPRWLFKLPNGDVLVAESNKPAQQGSAGIRGWIMGKVMARAGAGVPSADRITLLRDTDGDGVADQRSVFLKDLHSPFGMALIGNTFYVANANGVVAFPYRSGDTEITAAGKPIVDLPAGRNHHWTKNLIASRDGKRLYATVGSNSNVGENGMDEEVGRAAIWEIDPAAKQKRLFASGLRNPNGLAWEPKTGALWTSVNERDEIGSDLVPDYVTSVRDGGFYGWPYSYYGDRVDTRIKPPRPDLVATAIKPDYAVGAHTASLGIAFSTGSTLPEHFRHGMFIAQHGSWNRDPHSGYKVIYVPFQNGMPTGMPVDLLTGFLGPDGKAFGRPVGVIQDAKGALLVADDVGNVIWRVSAK